MLTLLPPWQHIALPLVDGTGSVVRFLAGTAPPIDRDGRALRSPF